MEKPFRNPFSLEGLKSSTEDLRVRRSTSMYRVFTSTRSFFFFLFFSPLPSIEYEDIIGTVVGRFELLVSSVSIVGRDELE